MGLCLWLRDVKCPDSDRQRGVEWQGASHKSPTLNFCRTLAYVWPPSVASVSGSSFSS